VAGRIGSTIISLRTDPAVQKMDAAQVVDVSGTLLALRELRQVMLDLDALWQTPESPPSREEILALAPPWPDGFWLRHGVRAALAVVTALVERSAVRMAQVFGSSVQASHGTTTPLLLQRAIRQMCVYVEENPAAVALCLTGGNDGPGRVMNERLVEFATALVRDRVPGVPEHETEIVARTAVGITLGMLNGYNQVEAQFRPYIEQELVYVLSAYLYARFPPPDDFTWTAPDRAVQPSRPSRRDFTESGRVWPALAPDQPS
jgi:hypothetical protein